MIEKMSKMTKKTRCFILFLLITFMFLILFNKFVFRDYVYVYNVNDVGSDTINSYYPILGGMSNMLHAGNFDIFSLKSGLGTDLSYLYSYFCNPFDLIAILFPLDKLHIGILLGTYLKLITIAFVSFGFFMRIFKNHKSALISTLSWTFCSYILIWGQHYVFCTNMMNFTIFMYLLQRWLMGSKKHLFILIPFMSFFLINSYYFFYISGIFGACYVMVYSWMKQENFKQISIWVLKLAGSALLAMMIGMFFFLPIILTFLASPRVDVLNAGFLDYFKPYSIQVYITNFARFLNSDLIGGGFTIPYTGSSNYYEAAFLSSSMLAIYAILYETFFSKHHRKKLVIFILFLILLSLPIFTYMLVFNPMAQRWTFVLLFLNSLCIGDLHNKVILEKNNRIAKYIGCIGLTVFAMLVLILKFAESKGVVKVNDTILVLITVFMLFYFLILINDKFKVYQKEKLIFSVIIVELIVMNYNAINDRSILKTNDFKNKYFDGTMQATQYLSESDPSLYRVKRTYDSVSLNDSLIQNFNGYNSYSSVTNSNLWNTAINYMGVWNGNSNYVYFNNSLFQSMMGGKYILSKHEIDNDELLKKVGNIYIYKDQLQMPFGYMYDKQIPNNNDYTSMSEFEKIKSLVSGFVANKDFGFDKVQGNIPNKDLNILSDFKFAANCKVKNKGMDVIGSSDDMQLYYPLDKTMNTMKKPVNSLKATFTSAVDSTIQFYFDTGSSFSEAESVKIPYRKGKNTIEIPLDNYKNIKAVRIDPSEVKQNIKMQSLDFIFINKEVFSKDIQKLKENGVKNASFKNSTYTGSVVNNSNKDKMLQVPITYSNNWQATIDGKHAEVQNINNGFIGVLIPSGEHEIIIRYRIPFTSISLSITCLGVLLYIVLINQSKIKKLIKK